MTVAIERDSRLDAIYDAAEQEYFESLQVGDFMEAFDHARQREITIESFALIRAERKDVHFFNEMVVIYPSSDTNQSRRVCPDNMVVLHDGELTVNRSYRIPHQPVGPFLALEYVSPYYQKKDYQSNMLHYEAGLKIPYYLIYYPERIDLIVYHHTGTSYQRLESNSYGRIAIPELELEVGISDGWVRYWFRGVQLPLPDELLGQLKSTRDQLDAERERRIELESEVSKLKAELTRLQDS